ncbi:MAG: HlyD family secretion protein [Fimbriimonas sp.]|nr:HlyD family secretion protein [Fimbriimonas sp.]
MATVIEKEEKTETTTGAIPTEGVASDPGLASKKSRKPLILAVIGALALVAAVMAIRFVVWASGHTSTDDATVTADVVQIAPQVTGTVIAVPVSENQHVKKGDVLVQLDSSSFETAVAQAKANLDLAVAQAEGASASVSLAKQTAIAQVTQAQGVVGQSKGGVFSSIADLAKARAGVAQSKAQASGADAGFYGAQANVSIAVASRQKAYDAVSSAMALLDSAQAAVNTAKANVDAAVATADNATKQAKRIETLYKQGAASGQLAEQTRAAADVAVAQVTASRQQVVQAQSVVVQRQAELRAARNQLPAADAAVAQAKAMLTSSQDQAVAAKETVQQYAAQVRSAQAAITQANARSTQAVGQFQMASEGPTQIQVSVTAEMQAQAKVEQAKAALRDAEINLARTRIVAPADGRISKNTVEVGNLVQPGSGLMSIVPDEDMWVVGNFKETQLADVKAGQPVDIDVDALPGKTFKGHVGSISAGTGSTFALLPPDNATGNFTKVVQRIPVKIILDHSQPDMDRLRTGMSVTATITTKQ